MVAENQFTPPAKNLTILFPKELKTLDNMHTRCYNKKNGQYHDYGGRGIVICDRWFHNFRNFLSDMGPKPTPKHQIERINNDGIYEPSNCCWATSKEQKRNTRQNHLLTFQGKTLCLTEWAEFLNLTTSIIAGRLIRGWSVEQSLTIPSPKPYPRIRNPPIEYNGRTQTINEWAKELGVGSQFIRNRIRSGWTIEEAFTIPIQKHTKFKKKRKID